MTTELLFYLVLSTCSFIYCFLNKNKYLVFISYIISGIYMWYVRNSGFDVDMGGYASFLHYLPSFDSASIYFVREFVYWFGSAYIFSFVQDEIWTFWIIDLIWVSLLFYSLGNRKQSYNIPLYIVPFMMVFFPVLMGYQNVYRQAVACMFIIFAFFGTRSTVVTFIFGLIAVFTHNSSIIYLPLLFLYRVTDGMTKETIRPLYKVIFSFLFLVTVGAVYYSSLGDTELSKSSNSTGMSLTFAYLLLFIIIIFTGLFTSSFKLKRFLREHFYAVYALSVFVLFIPVLGGAQAERIGMMFLIVIIPLFAEKLDKSFKNEHERILVRLIFVLVGIMPTFLFSSAFNFLITTIRQSG